VDLVIANGENASGGFGITPETAKELFANGIHFITTGNHVWDKREVYDYLEREQRIIRPANYPAGAPGRGSATVNTPGGIKIGILNLEGRIFMDNLECPFKTADREIASLSQTTSIIIVDFHAEATSEKSSLGWHLDGRVTAVIGTHTHVQTADERVLTDGTAYITDAGMTGSFDSVIGMRKDEPVRKFITQLPSKFEVAKKDIRINGVLLQIDETTGRATSIERINVACG
jgi:metallophosphoesterase (TIGR00282 family)